MELNRDGTDECQNVRSGLRHLNSEDPQELWQNQNHGYEEQTLPGDGIKGCGNGSAHGLLHHVAHDHPALDKEADALAAKCHGADTNNVGIIPEQADKPRSRQEAHNSDGGKKLLRRTRSLP